jgi:chemotaxis signal transduction protein
MTGIMGLTTVFGLTADAQSVRDAARRRAGLVEILVFRVGSERFGVGLAAVEEVVDLPVLRPLPHMPPAMLGVCELRASLVAVYTPGPALGAQTSEPKSALIVRMPARADRRAALAIDEAEGVMAFDFEWLTDVRGDGNVGEGGVVLGVSSRDGRLLAVLDAEALVAVCTADRVLETT